MNYGKDPPGRSMISPADGSSDMMEVSPYWQEQGGRFWSSTQFFRLVIVPVAVTLLLAGGVLWIRRQVAASAAASEDSSVVQVQLLPRPDSKPIPLAAASRPQTVSVAAHSKSASEKTEIATVEDADFTPEEKQFLSPDTTAPPSADSVPAPLSLPPSGIVAKFQRALLQHIERYEHYPDAARRDGLQGRVETLFTMRRDGRVLSVQVISSSGAAMLDSEALKAIRHAEPLPPIPPGLPDQLNIQLAIEFDPS